MTGFTSQRRWQIVSEVCAGGSKTFIIVAVLCSWHCACQLVTFSFCAKLQQQQLIRWCETVGFVIVVIS